MNRSLFVESDEALANLENECEGFAEYYQDDGQAEDAAACLAARDWLASLREHPKPFVIHIPEDVRHTVTDAAANLGEYDSDDGTAQPGAYEFFDAITSDANLRRLFDASGAATREAKEPTRYALVTAYNAAKATGADPWTLYVLASLLAQAGCVDAVDLKPMNGARDDYLTSVCDVAMFG